VISKGVPLIDPHVKKAYRDELETCLTPSFFHDLFLLHLYNPTAKHKGEVVYEGIIVIAEKQNFLALTTVFAEKAKGACKRQGKIRLCRGIGSDGHGDKSLKADQFKIPTPVPCSDVDPMLTGES